MKKKIAILGSTGSIGKTLLKIIKNDKKNFTIVLLSAKKNYKTLIKQANFFNVSNVIITDKKYYDIAKKNIKQNNINIYNNFDYLNQIIDKKIDYVMSSIIGLDGLKPTINIIKYTKNIAIANKEAIICGWPLIKKELKINGTNFLPVDSEHFSIWKILNYNSRSNVDKIFITASGGPFLKKTKKQIKNVKISEALNHPNWKMGKKISIDSATMMNKVFEVIETKNIFDVQYKNINILIHPSSYIHAIVKFNNGISQMVAHDTSMMIPIFNTLYNDDSKKIISLNLDIKKLNKLELQPPNLKKFPLIKVIELLPLNNSLFETILVTVNDEIVNLFLQKKINFNNISEKILRFINLNEFKKYKKISPKKIQDIVELSKYVSLKIKSLSV